MSSHTATVLRTAKWVVQRVGRIEQIDQANGGIQFRVKIWDEGRQAFITQWFNDIAPADDFLSRVMEENLSHFREITFSEDDVRLTMVGEEDMDGPAPVDPRR